ncbi:hypothetical protein BJX70DRAFT_353309 [Aspergillus crustosus]
MVALPLGPKSPWTSNAQYRMLAAVVTLGDLTFLDAQNITHARLANLSVSSHASRVLAKSYKPGLCPSQGASASVAEERTWTGTLKDHVAHCLSSVPSCLTEFDQSSILVALEIPSRLI